MFVQTAGAVLQNGLFARAQNEYQDSVEIIILPQKTASTRNFQMKKLSSFLAQPNPFLPKIVKEKPQGNTI
jgi:hypothetical protein